MTFVDREQELAFFNRIATRQRPGPAQLVLLYGRRRIGKTELLLHWSQRSGLPTTYWTTEKEPAALQRRKLFAALTAMPLQYTPIFASWAELWDAAAQTIGDQRRVLVLDELPYAVESDPATLSALQHAWDRAFQRMRAIIVLCGSQIRVMELLQAAQSPLFGRLTGQWHLQPLPFSALKAFFPAWSVEERIAAYALVGGVPAYLGWLDPDLTFAENVRQVVLDPGSLFSAEPTLLIYDEVREPQPHLAILKAIGAGAHALDDISNATLIGKTHLSSYLVRLQELRLIERRLPATLASAQRLRSRKGRYHLSDPYFRFYFRFLAPAHEQAGLSRDQIWSRIQQDLRAFIGQTAFEDLARAWVLAQGQAGVLPFAPEMIGSHWSRHVQADVVAVNWRQRMMLVGECKWSTDRVDRQIIRDLIDGKTPLILRDLPDQGREWNVTHACFARGGFTDAARQLMNDHHGFCVGMDMLDRELP
jgi:AAA+ ATPase superfamily predicted ATPase